MLLITGLVLFALGLVVWFYGNRMWLLGAGAGALLGFGLVNCLIYLLLAGWDFSLWLVWRSCSGCWALSVRRSPRSSPWSSVSLPAERS